MSPSIFEEIIPKPSRFKLELRKYGIPASHVASYLGYSYTYIVNVLNGISKITPPVEKKLQLLVDRLEAQEADNRKES